MSLKTALNGILAPAVAAADIPGVVALVTNREGTLYEGAFGVRKLGDPAPMTTDTVGLIASMTKAITTTAAMQLVEQGKLDLDSPASKWLPDLGKVQVLEGFDAAGKPKLRAPKRPVALKHLLTHTSGFSYEFTGEGIKRFQEATGTPGFSSSAYASLQTPLLFDPGERWEYGISTDWAGLLVQKASDQRLGDYLQQHILKPLGMNDTAITMRPDMRARLASIHARLPDGNLAPIDLILPQEPETHMGGQALYGTMPDYGKFLRMILNRGLAPGGRVLKAESIDAMSRNQIGDITMPAIKSMDKTLSNDMELPPDNPHYWSYGFMMNSKALPTGRKPNSLAWAGLCNSFYWIDPASGIAGAYLTQILPFADVKSFPLYFAFEATTYQNL